MSSGDAGAAVSGPACPVCTLTLPPGADINRHLDECLSAAAIAEAHQDGAAMDLETPPSPPTTRRRRSRLDSASRRREADRGPGAMELEEGRASADSIVVPRNARAQSEPPVTPPIDSSQRKRPASSPPDDSLGSLGSLGLVTGSLGSSVGSEEADLSSPPESQAQSKSPGPSPSKKRHVQPSIASFFGGNAPRRKVPAVVGVDSQSKSSRTAKSVTGGAGGAKGKAKADRVSPSDEKFSTCDEKEHPKALLYLHMAETLKSISLITGRKEITRQLTAMLVAILRASPRSTIGDPSLSGTAATDHRPALSAIYLCSNAVAPEYHGIELGVGGSTVSAAVSEASGRSSKQLRIDYTKFGDMGDVAQHACKSVRTLFQPKPLTILDVHANLLRMSTISGKGAANRKKAIILKLLVACRGDEPTFIVRTLLGNLRTGAVGRTLQTAIAHAFVEFLGCGTSLDAAAEQLKLCYSQHPNWENIIVALLHGGFAGLGHACAPKPGVPLKPMLAKVTSDPAVVLTEMADEAFQADFKYDGARAQIHLAEDGTVHIFSRHLEDVTDRYPDAVAALRRAVETTGVRSLISDTEIVAWDREKGEILPFQTLMSRPRKGVVISNITVHIKIMFFDLMALNGVSLLDVPFGHRRRALYKSLAAHEDEVGFAEQRVFIPDKDGSGHDGDELMQFLRQAFASRCEGLMVKQLGTTATDLDLPFDGDATDLTKHASRSAGVGTYEPSKRCKNWLKIKRDYLDGVGDTLDVVPIGGWWGNGRKAGWFSPVLLAVFDPETETLQSLCKCMSGFTDEFYKGMLTFYEGCTTDVKSDIVDVHPDMTPNFWFTKFVVWEMKGAEFTLSPTHRAATGRIEGTDRGLSVRFPRFIRARDDKGYTDATTVDQLIELYEEQLRRASGDSGRHSNPTSSAAAEDADDAADSDSPDSLPLGGGPDDPEDGEY